MRKFRIVNSNVRGADIISFEIEDDATEDEVAEAAFELIAERVDFGLEEVKGGEA